MNRESIDRICSMIESVKSVRTLIGGESDQTEVAKSLKDLTENINLSLYHTKQLDFQCIGSMLDEGYLVEFDKEAEQLLSLWEKSIEKRSGVSEYDAMFEDLYEYFLYVRERDIYNNSIFTYKSLPVDDKQLMEGALKKFIFLDGSINEESGDYSLISDYVHMLKEYVEDFRWLYSVLSDDRSRIILLNIISSWITYDIHNLLSLKENIFSDYYDRDIIRVDQKEVPVDCGAYIGDSIRGYIDSYGDLYKHIYAYEMSPKVFQVLQEETSDLRDIIYRNVGVSNQHETMFIKNENWLDAASLSDTGTTEVETVALDEDIDEPITMIKMDIEGAEMAALEGARNHIINEKPKLLISAYHRPEHIFTIPRRISEYRDDYKLYLRYNGKTIWPADFIVLAV